MDPNLIPGPVGDGKSRGFFIANYNPIDETAGTDFLIEDPRGEIQGQPSPATEKDPIKKN